MRRLWRSPGREGRAAAAGIILTALIVFAAGCPQVAVQDGSGLPQPGTGQGQPDIGPSAPGGGGNEPDGQDSVPNVTEVWMEGIAFQPKEVTINRGDIVRWTNMDAVFHTVTSGAPGDADAGSLFASGFLGAGETFEHQFLEVGEFEYFCEVHPFVPEMRDAKVIVVP